MRASPILREDTNEVIIFECDGVPDTAHVTMDDTPQLDP